MTFLDGFIFGTGLYCAVVACTVVLFVLVSICDGILDIMSKRKDEDK